MLQLACRLWLLLSTGTSVTDLPGAQSGLGIQGSIWVRRQHELQVWIPAGELRMSVVFISPTLPFYYSQEMQPKSRRCADSMLYLSSSELIMDLEKWVITLIVQIQRGCYRKAVVRCSWPNGSPLNCLPFSSLRSDSAHPLALVAPLTDFHTFLERFDPRSSLTKSSTHQSAKCVALLIVLRVKACFLVRGK